MPASFQALLFSLLSQIHMNERWVEQVFGILWSIWGHVWTGMWPKAVPFSPPLVVTTLWFLVSLEKCNFWVLERRVSRKALHGRPEVMLFSRKSINWKYVHCACVHVCVCVWILVYIVYTCIGVMGTCMYIHAHARVYVSTCVRVYTYVFTHTHTYLRIFWNAV